MWQVDNRTPFAAEQGWIRDREGAEVWLVVVKASFNIWPDGSTEVSKEQPPPLRVPEHYGEAGRSSIRYDSDFVLTKTTTDIVVVGHAYAPDGRPVRQLDVGFRVGAVRKLRRVSGDRSWSLLGPGEPEPFIRMPLVYERAFGGVDLCSEHPDKDWDWRNPVGCGFAVKAAHLQGVPVPNIESADHPIGAWDDRPAPAGFHDPRRFGRHQGREIDHAQKIGLDQLRLDQRRAHRHDRLAREKNLAFVQRPDLAGEF